MKRRASGTMLALGVVLMCWSTVTASAQEASQGTTTRLRLIGRTETATVELTRQSEGTADDLIPWRRAQPPLTAGTGTAAQLTTDLPLRFGSMEVPAGRYHLLIERDSILAIMRDGPPTATREVVGRVTLAGTAGLAVINGWSLAVVTTRHGSDTTGVAERRSEHVTVITISHLPGTSSTLRLRWLDRALTVPIAAR
jgi:hypothetical protein